MDFKTRVFLIIRPVICKIYLDYVTQRQSDIAETLTELPIPEIKSDRDIQFSGNGPSGISLSYLLSGNWPYYTRDSDDEMLHARLMDQPHLSLVEQDLEFLSDVSLHGTNM